MSILFQKRKTNEECNDSLKFQQQLNGNKKITLIIMLITTNIYMEEFEEQAITNAT